MELMLPATAPPPIQEAIKVAMRMKDPRPLPARAKSLMLLRFSFFLAR